MGGQVLSEYVALRAKSYCLLSVNDTTVKRSKGTPRMGLATLTMQDFKDALFNSELRSVNAKQITTHKHSVYLTDITKTALNAFCDKRFYLTPVCSRSYGNCRDTPHLSAN